jgi:hypothetical protein
MCLDQTHIVSYSDALQLISLHHNTISQVLCRYGTSLYFKFSFEFLYELLKKDLVIGEV